MPQSFGGYVWSTNESPTKESDSSKVGVLALAAGVGVAGFAASTRDMANGFRPIDYVAAGARYAGNLSPMQLGNTFRIPELLSPWTSDRYRGMGFNDVAGQGYGFAGGTYSWDRSYLGADSTYDWIKHVSQRDDSALREAGITRGMLGHDNELAQSLAWERTPGSRHSGRLLSRVGDTTHVLANDVAIMAASHEQNTVLSTKSSINRMLGGVFAASGVLDRQGVDAGTFEDTIFSRVIRGAGDEAVRQGASHVPVPALRLNGSHGTTMIRGVAAFEMGRFNRLLGEVSEQFLGKSTSARLGQMVGGLDVRTGTASAQFMRFGGKAALVGAAALAVGETDWMRRRFGLAGNVVASAGVSAGVGWAFSKLSRTNPMAARWAAVGSFFGQMILPGFNQGLVQGVATTYANATVLRANAFNPFNYMRRGVEGFAPGFTGWQVGALAAVGAAAATSLRIPGVGRLPQVLASHYNVGIDATDVDMATRSVRDRYYTNLMTRYGGDPNSMRDRFNMIGNINRATGDSLETLHVTNSAWKTAEDSFMEHSKRNPINTQLLAHLKGISERYAGGDLLSRVAQNVEGHAANTYFSFFGADLTRVGEDALADISAQGFKGMGRLGRAATVGAMALAAHQFFFGGALGSMETADDLRQTYSGNKLVEIKSGRFWEGGGTPYEGDKTSFFRPHWYPLLMSGAKDAGVWGDNPDAYDPISKFALKNFTYHLEREHYYDRPYPISGAAFADVPVIGGLLSNTVGRLIKPPKIMHASEWISEQNGQLGFASVFEGSRREPAYSLGAPGPGVPQSPFAAKEQLASLSYQFRELEGLTGWAKNVVQAALTGSDKFNVGTPMLATANDMTSDRQAFWEMDLGGMMFSNEFLRRFWPKTPYEKKRVNPLTNSMPSWMPDRFHYGDPYSGIKTGYARLPGTGFAALHPELKGLDPEDYPMIYRYGILSDVAPYSEELRRMKTSIYTRRQKGEFNETQEAYIDRVDDQHARVMNQVGFDYVNERAIQLPGSQVTQKLYAGAQHLLRKVAAPAEYMVPMGFRPVQKLLPDRDPIEQYEYERMYGTPMSFWDKPWRDWFRPALYSGMNLMGYEGKPLWRMEADATNSYFDKLSYLKYMQASAQAKALGDNRGSFDAAWQAGQTREGVNPMGNPLAIYWSIPAEERKFFNAFSNAQGQDRQRILDMVPADQKHLYEAVWYRQDSGDPSLWAGASSQVDRTYLDSQMAGVQQEMAGQPMPGEDWIGWQQDVDMDDIRVRYVDGLGKDIHDFGLWESQLAQSQSQPFLEGSVNYITEQGGINYLRSGMHGLLGNGSYSQVSQFGSGSSLNVTYNDTRDGEINDIVQRRLNAY